MSGLGRHPNARRHRRSAGVCSPQRGFALPRAAWGRAIDDAQRTRERRHPSAGFTLIEVTVTLAILAMVLGAVAFSIHNAGRAHTREEAGKLAAAIRYSYDRSITTGGYYRIVLDLSSNKYWSEKSDERYYLAREKEESRDGKAPDLDAKERKEREAEEEAAKQQQQMNGLAQQLQPPPAPRRARFQTFKDNALPKVDLKGCRVRDIYTPRQREPYTEGKAYLYFFPDGHTERAVIHVANEDGDVYTLIVHPLTGHVEVKTGDLPAPRNFDDSDDSGQQEAPR